MTPPYGDDRREGPGGACRTCINITKWMPVLFISAVISWSYYAFVYQLCILAMRQLWAQILSMANLSRSIDVMERLENARSETELTEILEEFKNSTIASADESTY
ncbi:Palmitoyltransferase ZDHHC2 [Orchesella cincta]|uniref:Palmitoyltransferase ZDHHC2 n=1 Tax=Orchesella cincta TaxID=48709 RepID=A0A1D2MRR4_ORCCI|nr:Palmitoyltransferase ZDHHC2 [Orchesella cincta]